ncbi:MAG TPA: hypothetical protein VHN81_02630 [Edaphobacter sp.]|nr:hypothetical protein [Edaphobacter sp.]
MRELPWQPADRRNLVLLFLATALLSAIQIHWHQPPAEDALMLLRYATHFAHGQGITWNIGDKPVEGATDFLWMATIGVAMKLLHTGAILTSRVLLILSHALDVVIVYTISRRLFGSGRALAIGLAIYLMIGPAIPLTNDSFSPAFYALAALGAWWCALHIVVRGTTTGAVWGFALLGLITGMIRPDGVLLAVFMLVDIVFALATMDRRKEIPRIVLTFAAVMVLLGGAYFLWRWHYFGYPLPNPFYRKGGGHIYPDSLHRSALNVTKLLLPTMPIAALALLKGEWRRTIFVYLPAALFACSWILLTNENNSNMRFQYVTLPITLVTFPWLIAAVRQHVPGAFDFKLSESQKLAFTLVITLVAGGLYWRVLLFYPIGKLGSGAYEIAHGLHQWKDRHYTMAVTEAGVIPYFSEWRVIDAYGLNDSEIVHNPKGLTDAYLDANKPAVIMLHLSPGVTGYDGFVRAWRGEAPVLSGPSQYMVSLAHYAATHNYELAARWGDHTCNVHIWYVRRDIPEFNPILKLIRHQPHYFLDDGISSYNYLDDTPPAGCSDPGFSIPASS